MMTILITLCVVLSGMCCYLYFLQRNLKRLLIDNSDKEKEKSCHYCKTTEFVHRVEVFPGEQLFCSHYCLTKYKKRK